MSSGGVRYDFTLADRLAYGSSRWLAYRLRDAAGKDYKSFAGMTFKFFLIDAADAADGIDALEATNELEVGQVDLDLTNPPYVRVPIGPDDWPVARPVPYWHELWRIDAGNEDCVSAGDFPVVH